MRQPPCKAPITSYMKFNRRHHVAKERLVNLAGAAGTKFSSVAVQTSVLSITQRAGNLNW